MVVAFVKDILAHNSIMKVKLKIPKILILVFDALSAACPGAEFELHFFYLGCNEVALIIMAT